MVGRREHLRNPQRESNRSGTLALNRVGREETNLSGRRGSSASCPSKPVGGPSFEPSPRVAGVFSRWPAPICSSYARSARTTIRCWKAGSASAGSGLPAPAWRPAMGSASDIDTVKAEFKAAWQALKARTQPEQLAAAYQATNIRDR
jgi:hypothetical protein